MLQPDDFDIPFVPTPFLMVQYLSAHPGIVKDVKDPWGVGRVKVECSNLAGTGQQNWQGWLHVVGTVGGGGETTQGDQGDWNPVQPDQVVYVAFLEGHPNALYCFAGPPVQKDQDGNQTDKQLVPLEVKKVTKNDFRDAARLRVIKSPTGAGHTIIMDDRGTKELLAFLDWTGSGYINHAPGKVEDEKEKEGEESKPRKGERRGTKNVFAGTSERPGKLLKDGVQILGHFDLNQTGWVTVAEDDKGKAFFFCGEKPGDPDCYLVMDANKQTGPLTILGAGGTQIQLDGKTGNIRATRLIVQEPNPIDVKPVIAKVKEALKKRAKEYDDE